MKPSFFASAQDFQRWLEKNHAREQELWVGFHKKDSGKPSITWPESVDAALCFGWIDGVRKSVDDESYVIRFTPRKASSRWSTVNVRRVQELQQSGLMHEAGQRAFEARTQEGTYSYEQRNEVRLSAAEEKKFKADKPAWDFFSAQPVGYRRTATYWVTSAKREDTRAKRLATLIEDSANKLRIALLRRTK
ncbi:MAG TPA: YdeI/OmpD-associated family protein [Terriglobales bacterium]